MSSKVSICSLPKILVRDIINESKSLITENPSMNSINTRNISLFNVTFYNDILDEIIERRKIGKFYVNIGMSSGEWCYHINLIENNLSKDEIEYIRSIRENISEILTLDIFELLKDQRLAQELIKSQLISNIQRIGIHTKEELAEIIARHTIGIGILEYILMDPCLEDIILNSPVSQNRIYVATRLYSNNESVFCKTNLSITEENLNELLTRIMIFYGGELSHKNPILELEIPHLKARITSVAKPASPHGLTLSVRKRMNNLWTLPRLIGLGSISWTASGFLSLCCQARASIIITGGRGSGKTTLLSALIPELPQIGRIIVMEDTEEIPTMELQKIGFSIQNLSLSGGMDKAEAIMHAALRMGEGPIIVGEIRGAESKILFESIRTGTANSSVMGTLHASDPSFVRDRIVSDMGLDDRSFKSIDLIVMVQQKKDTRNHTFSRYISGICGINISHEEYNTPYYFKADNLCNCLTNLIEFDDLGNIGRKICTFLGVKENEILRTARIRGLLKKIQADEWINSGDERFISPFTTSELNRLAIDIGKEFEYTHFRNIVIDVAIGG